MVRTKCNTFVLISLIKHKLTSKDMKKIMMALTLALFAVAAQAENLKEVVFNVTPQMTCNNCEKKIKSNIRFEKGVKKIDTSLEKQTVTISYDADKTDEAKIASAFKKIGYEAKQAGVCTQAHGTCANAQGACDKAHGSCTNTQGSCTKAQGACCKQKTTCPEKKVEAKACCKKEEKK